MKKLLLTLGTVAAVAAPVASVVACGDTKADTTFDKDVKAYQALQVMGWSNTAGIHVNVAPAGTTWSFKADAATVFTDASKTAAINSGPLEVLKINAPKAKELLVATKKVFDQTLKDFEAVANEIKKNTKTPSKIEMAGEKLLEALETKTGTRTGTIIYPTYTDAEKVAAAQLNQFLSDKSALSNGDKLETLGTVTVATTGTEVVTLTDKEKSLLTVGLPLLLKLSKTIEGLKTIAEAV